jgi:hypothetical protein
MGQNIGDFFKSLGIDVNELKKELNSKSIQNTKKKKKVTSIKKRDKNPKLFK